MTPGRSTETLDPDVFTALVELTIKQPWLAERGEEFLSISKEFPGDKEFELLVDLVSRFNYVTSSDIRRAGREIVRMVEHVWDLDPTDTVITAKNIDDQNDSSGALSYHMQTIFAGGNKHWIKNNFRSNIKPVLFDGQIKNLILIDDFSGSGKSLNKLLTWIQNNTPTGGVKNVYACFVCCMQATFDKDYPSILKKLHASRSLTRGISDYYTTDLADKVATMQKMESRLVGLPANYHFGYEASEALYACENFNIPNNNFPIFWFRTGGSGRRRVALLPRIERR